MAAADAQLATRIKRARERLRLSQQALATAIGVSQKTIDNWENARTSPRSSIGALEHVLGVPLTEEDTGAAPPIDPRVQQILDDLSPEEVQRVIEYLTGRRPREAGRERAAG